MDWKKATISHSSLKFVLLGIIPTIVVILLQSLLPELIGYKKNDIFIASFLLLSLPHFALSIHDLALHRQKEVSFQLTSKRSHLVFVLALIAWITSFIFLSNLLSLIPLLVLFAYQSHHYAMQNYGIFRYFNGKNSYKIIFVLLSFLFFFNLSLHSLKEAKILTEASIDMLEKTFFFAQVTLFAFCVTSIIAIDKPRSREDFSKYSLLIIWFIWVYLSKDLLFLLFLPLLHSLQYLPFFQMKIVSRGRAQGQLWKNHIFVNGLTLLMAFILLKLNLNEGAQKVFLTLAIVINMIHIHVDSYLWKSHES